MDWDRELLVDLNGGKTQLVFFDQSNITGAKMDRSVLEEKSCFKILGLIFSSQLDWALTLSQLVVKLFPKKLEP